MQIFLSVTPGEARAAAPYHQTPAHVAYRIGSGSTLLRAGLLLETRGGLLCVSDREAPAIEAPAALCQAVLRECAARNISPAPVEDVCNVLFWMQQHSEEYYIDLNNVFTVGDSAGGQINFQLMTMLTNPEYAKLFPFPVPEDFTVRGCGMNCGCYFLPFSRLLKPKTMGPLFEAYFPEDYLPLIPQFKAQKFITKDFPPAFVMSAQNDYLRFMAAPLHRILKKKGVESILKIYGTKAQKEIGHVFHLNCHSELADQCNDEQTAFFKAHIQ